MNGDTPIFGIIDKRNAKSDHLTDKTLRYTLNLLISQSSIKRDKVNSRRYDKAIVYMFRKRFNGKLKMENSVNSNIAEKLMAHKKGLDGVYLEPTRDECYNEFTKAIPQLTVDPTERQKIEIVQKQEKIDKLEQKEKQIEQQQESFEQFKKEQQEKIDKMQAQMDRLLHTAQSSGMVKQVKVSN